MPVILVGARKVRSWLYFNRVQHSVLMLVSCSIMQCDVRSNVSNNGWGGRMADTRECRRWKSDGGQSLLELSNSQSRVHVYGGSESTSA